MPGNAAKAAVEKGVVDRIGNVVVPMLAAVPLAFLSNLALALARAGYGWLTVLALTRMAQAVVALHRRAGELRRRGRDTVRDRRMRTMRRALVMASSASVAAAVGFSIAPVGDWHGQSEFDLVVAIAVRAGLAAVWFVLYAAGAQAAADAGMCSMRGWGWLVRALQGGLPQRLVDWIIAERGKVSRLAFVVVVLTCTSEATGMGVDTAGKPDAADSSRQGPPPAEPSAPATGRNATAESPPPAPVVGPLATVICGYDPVVRFHDKAPPAVAAALAEAWARHGAEVVGCPDDGVEERGGRWAAILHGGLSEPAMVVGDAAGAAVVFAQLVARAEALLDRRQLAAARRRATGKRGDLQAFVRADGTCELHQRITFADAYVHLPPAAAAAVMAAALDRQRLPTEITATNGGSFHIAFGDDVVPVRPQATAASPSCAMVPAYETLAATSG